MATPSRPIRPHSLTGSRRSDAVPTTTPSAPDDEQLLYTPAEAAQLLQVRESWLRKKGAARAVPCTFLGKHLRFSRADLAAIVAAAARPATGRRARRRSTTTTVRDRDLLDRPQRSVHPPDRGDHSCEGSTTWPG
jgi:excisionase family DNA binding protein